MDFEKEVGVLRCSKLNCYAEFNRMVQALSHCKRIPVYTIPGAKDMHGTSMEYNFYISLSTMLQQVAGNHSVESQKLELQRVYEWFKVNKPLLKTKTKASIHKPKIGYAARAKPSVSEPFFLGRPQTAPASLYQGRRSKQSYTTTMTGGEGDKRRPRTTFTSDYISRSLGHKMDFVGQSLDQLELPATAAGSTRTDANDTSSRAGTPVPAQVSIQAHPHPDFLSGYIPPGFSGVQPHMADSVSFAEVFYMAPAVAAQITLEKTYPSDEEYEMRYLRRRLTGGQVILPPGSPGTPPSHPTNTPITQSTVLAAKPPSTAPAKLFTDTLDKNHCLATISQPRMVVTVEEANTEHPMSSQSAGPPSERVSSSEQPHLLLETIAETECEMASSCGTGRTQGDSAREEVAFTPPRVTRTWPKEACDGLNGGDNIAEETLPASLVEGVRESSSTGTAGYSPDKPTVTISSHHTTTRQPPAEPAYRFPAVVSITFPSDEPIPKSGSSEHFRQPKKSPSVVAGFKKKRYQRPQTVPAIKIQSLC